MKLVSVTVVRLNNWSSRQQCVTVRKRALTLDQKHCPGPYSTHHVGGVSVQLGYSEECDVSVEVMNEISEWFTADVLELLRYSNRD